MLHTNTFVVFVSIAGDFPRCNFTQVHSGDFVQVFQWFCPASQTREICEPLTWLYDILCLFIFYSNRKFNQETPNFNTIRTSPLQICSRFPAEFCVFHSLSLNTIEIVLLVLEPKKQEKT